MHPSKQWLYVVHGTASGEVSSYAIEASGDLRRQTTQPLNSGAPCHVSIDSFGKSVLVATYSGGCVASLPILKDGSAGPAESVIENAGRGPNKVRQERPHLHSIYHDPQSSLVFACDLGTDEVLVYRLAEGRLQPNSPKAGRVPPGSGPRHLCFHPSGRYIYVNNEMSCTVTVFELEPAIGGLREIQTISTLPAGTDLAGVSTAEIAIDATGTWLYVSNRGHDSIAQFEVTGEGTLSLTEVVKLEVREPRSFALTQGGEWLVVAGQKSHEIQALRLGQDGRIGEGTKKVALNSPVCVLPV